MSDDQSNPDVDALFEDDPGSLDEVVDEEDAEDLKLDSVDTKVWLVKISLVLPDGETSENIPQEYSISILPGEVHNKFVFSENEHGGKSISGTVHHECAATPTQLGSYRNIMRKRVIDAGTPQRTVQVLGQNNQPVFVPGASNSMPTSSFSDFITAKKRRTDKEKATRMPRNELMDLLFAAFERYPYWTFRGIVEHTKQPAQYLKEILSDICIHNKRGPYAGNYQLRPEYKQRPSAAELPEGDNEPQQPSSDDDDEDEEAMEMIHV
ncbi:hypothetical protein EC973_007642 [Apophysomyces ossiformis]|uniref:Transcription initiation factor IIF subunit beta n=1 Tax=Apophysomyces ossiformis TaxID=679940 RepID=A0A8H7EU29_9FUNG|nr:hypothetical protein EC973_007642 [Apophysomyces ossiformis]